MRQEKHRYVRPVLSIIMASGLLTLLGLLSLAQKGAPPARPQHKFKNVKVLKNLPASQMIPVMRKISDSLGVKCDFCHVVNPDFSGFDRDDKPMKKVAREMIVMTQNINQRQKILGKKATCYMCHHGHAEPETQAPATETPPGAAR